MLSRINHCLIAGIVAALLAVPASATTIVVNSTSVATADDGACTLPEAIVAANTNVASGAMPNECAAGEPAPAVDTIAFAIPGGTVQTIALAAPLPTVTETVTIDGYTQPAAHANTLARGDDAAILIELDASAIGPSAMLNVQSSAVTIRGLVMSHLPNIGLFVTGDDNVVIGDFFQTDPTGNLYEGDGTTESMIVFRGNGNRIGSPDPADRNVIGGGGATTVGTIELAGDATVIQGNYIGLTADGTAALTLAVETNAIELGAYGASTNTLIGGDVPGAGNAILGTNVGIQLGVGTDGDDTTIEGNTIGTDASGTYALSPGQAAYGIMILNSKNTTIGGTTEGAGNVISGNATGIMVYTGNEPGTVIEGNRIGTDASGLHAVPNRAGGIVIASPGVEGTTPVLSTIGGTDPGAANTIAYNCGAGIAFQSSPTITRWPILGNAIFRNSALGISLDGEATPLPNDDGDPDVGSNNFQNYPVVTSATVAGGTATISGTLNSTPSTTFRLEFFANVECDASGFGEGRQFIGTTDVTTGADGNASFGPLSFAAPDGSDITATATDPDGNTSEFSACVGPHDFLFAGDFDAAPCI